VSNVRAQLAAQLRVLQLLRAWWRNMRAMHELLGSFPKQPLLLPGARQGMSRHHDAHVLHPFKEPP
jgi:hypothetical protein